MTQQRLCAPPELRSDAPVRRRVDEVVGDSGPCVPERPGAPRTGTAGPRRRTDGYAHLAPLFVELAALASDDPRRAALREQLITGHLPVARHVARRYAHRGEALQDLEQVATLGLIQAVDRFEPDRGPDFLSFAVPTISGEVLRYFRDRAWVIRVPRRLKDLQVAIYGVVGPMGQELGRSPRPGEIAARLGIEVQDVVDGLQVHHAYHCFSLDEPAGTDPGAGGVTRFGAALGRPDPGVALVENRQALGPLLEALPDRERTIVLLRFFGEMTQTQIAREIGISQMHVSRLLTATLTRLRRALTAGT
ncbi:SigB/SigF/SigG family RNA polymerase sigma factor [Pseudonocardia sp. H11422]|uniref:SigB/SigF/SigG family RNA polymerase sigma factor n=1 Tax=Pseudonocardia sp. H11422 TaxID=2835866 RepID=UPI001BDD681C|nr:SigB/SigF/SigG family RNA polymerase sigma factor [Pseudonocardia sp. H11422]